MAHVHKTKLSDAYEKQVAQPWQRAARGTNTSKSAVVKGWVSSGLNIRFKGFTANIYIPLDRGMEVFTQSNFVADFKRLNMNLIQKNDKFAF